jgi:hypothetical protein
MAAVVAVRDLVKEFRRFRRREGLGGALRDLVSRRYERGAIILTSNQSLGAWGEVFGDPVIATAILDRLLHHSITVNIKGDSYRLREKLKAGLLKPRGAEPVDSTQSR